MDNVFGKIFKGDKTIWCIFIVLCVISLLEVFSASSTIVYRQQNAWGPIMRHAFFMSMGFALVLFLQRVPTRYFSSLIILLPLTWILLLLTKFVGESVNGAQRWLGVGFFTVQPSELAKLAMVGFMAFFLSRMNKKNESLVFKILLWGIFISCILIVSENLSTACLLFAVCYLLMFIGQVDFKKFGYLTLICVAGVVLVIGTLKVIPEDAFKDSFLDRFSTWKSRIERFTEPKNVDLNITTDSKIPDDIYQETHAKIAIANGNIPGLPGSSVERDFLPQAYSDFIYAIVLEELGLPGGILVILLYVALMIRVGVLASRSDKLFPRYLMLGCALMITLQALLNMSVAVGIIPVTGQPLPLLSRGGTSTIITCAYFGIILACSNIAKEESTEEVKEIETVVA